MQPLEKDIYMNQFLNDPLKGKKVFVIIDIMQGSYFGAKGLKLELEHNNENITFYFSGD